MWLMAQSHSQRAWLQWLWSNAIIETRPKKWSTARKAHTQLFKTCRPVLITCLKPATKGCCPFRIARLSEVLMNNVEHWLTNSAVQVRLVLCIFPPVCKTNGQILRCFPVVLNTVWTFQEWKFLDTEPLVKGQIVAEIHVYLGGQKWQTELSRNLHQKGENHSDANLLFGMLL